MIDCSPSRLAAAQLDVYELAVLALTELERLIATFAINEPARRSVRALADATRDATAVQLSTARWFLDL